MRQHHSAKNCPGELEPAKNIADNGPGDFEGGGHYWCDRAMSLSC